MDWRLDRKFVIISLLLGLLPSGQGVFFGVYQLQYDQTPELDSLEGLCVEDLL